MNKEHLREGYQPTNNSIHPQPQTGHQPAQTPTSVTPPPNGPAYQPNNNGKK